MANEFDFTAVSAGLAGRLAAEVTQLQLLNETAATRLATAAGLADTGANPFAVADDAEMEALMAAANADYVITFSGTAVVNELAADAYIRDIQANVNGGGFVKRAAAASAATGVDSMDADAAATANTLSELDNVMVEYQSDYAVFDWTTNSLDVYDAVDLSASKQAAIQDQLKSLDGTLKLKIAELAGSSGVAPRIELEDQATANAVYEQYLALVHKKK